MSRVPIAVNIRGHFCGSKLRLIRKYSVYFFKVKSGFAYLRMKFILSNKGKRKLTLSCFLYVCNKSKNGVTCWRRENFRKCRTRLSTTNIIQRKIQNLSLPTAALLAKKETFAAACSAEARTPPNNELAGELHVTPSGKGFVLKEDEPRGCLYLRLKSLRIY